MARDQQKYIGLSRSLIANRYRTDEARKKKAVELKGIAPSPKFSLKDFLTEKVWKWIEHSTRHLFGSKHKFQHYSENDKGVYSINTPVSNGEIRIALAADWASDTEESIAVSEKIEKHDAHFTIHMGDTYYTGERNEIADNFLGENPAWPRGSLGTFAMMGNHEMYSMANPYFNDLLPNLGMRGGNGQGASYFCLYTDHWLIIGLDTGYNSVSFPFVWNSFKNNCHLPDELVNWLITEVKPLSETRGIIVLSHHQYISAFRGQKNYAIPGEQLAKIFGLKKNVIWIWGHEHRLALYKVYSSAQGIIAYGRCIGHGGMPVELDEMKVDETRAGAHALVAVDKRRRTTIDKIAIGWNGYAVLKINNEVLAIEYYDQNELLLIERWKSEKGIISGISITQLKTTPDFAPQPEKEWLDAIKAPL